MKTTNLKRSWMAKKMKREELVVKPYTLCYEGCYHKPEADSVMDSMEARIKELELALSNSREHEKALRKCFDNHRQRIKELEEENKHLEDYIDAYQKSEALNIEKLDKKDERIKELESDLSTMETDYEFRIKNVVNVQNDTELRLQNRIKELEQVISKKETTQKWISVKDRLPEDEDTNDGGFVLVDIHEIIDYPIPGIERVRVQEIYYENLAYDEENDCGIFVNTEHIMPDLDKCWFTHWMPLPPPPTTEEI